MVKKLRSLLLYTTLAQTEFILFLYYINRLTLHRQQSSTLPQIRLTPLSFGYDEGLFANDGNDTDRRSSEPIATKLKILLNKNRIETIKIDDYLYSLLKAW